MRSDQCTYTHDILGILDYLTPHPIQVSLSSCYGGATEVDPLKPGSTLIITAGYDVSTSGMGVHLLKSEIELMKAKGYLSPEQSFLYTMKNTVSLATFHHKISKGKVFTYRLGTASRPLNNRNLLQNFLKFKWSEFIAKYTLATSKPPEILSLPEDVMEAELKNLIWLYTSHKLVYASNKDLKYALRNPDFIEILKSELKRDVRSYSRDSARANNEYALGVIWSHININDSKAMIGVVVGIIASKNIKILKGSLLRIKDCPEVLAESVRFVIFGGTVEMLEIYMPYIKDNHEATSKALSSACFKNKIEMLKILLPYVEHTLPSVCIDSMTVHGDQLETLLPYVRKHHEILSKVVELSLGKLPVRAALL